jgi:threonine dehydratase
VTLKAECLQHSGSFKFRGAYNRLAQIPARDRVAGVVAWSSGNHAQGVAAAGRLLGIPTTIVMPRDAPAIKRRNTLQFGSEIIDYDQQRESREDIGRELARSRGATIVAPYDDYQVMAGQGTCGLELLRQHEALGCTPDIVLVSCGGGGLCAGIATAITSKHPHIEVYAVEPAGFDDHRRSLQSGVRETNAASGPALCDALLAPQPGELTFPINQRLLSGALAVTDDDVKAAMRFAFEHFKIVVEPGGAAALAALLSAKVDAHGKRVCVVVSGGNVDPETYARIIAPGA